MVLGFKVGSYMIDEKRGSVVVRQYYLFFIVVLKIQF